MTSTWTRAAALTLGCTLLAACGGGGGGSVGPGTPPPGGGGNPQIAVNRVFAQLEFVQPTVLKQAPGDASRWFVGEKSGVIRVFANNPASSATSVFLDIRGRVDASGEGGLLGFAFHPDFLRNGEVYVSYTRGGPFRSYVSRFFSTDNGLTLSPAPEEIILELPQFATNHNGGDIAFGPDGFLYVAFGDGGGAGDPQGNGQDDTNLHGTIVRIDVDSANPYAIPVGNPNAPNAACVQGSGAAPCPEIFAWGLRNPWRFSFDRQSGALWTGDVGQGAWEEIDRVVAGGNYGWNVREGDHCYEPPNGCADTFEAPVTEYDHSLGSSVTGGYVYRGAAVDNLAGRYVFGDFISGRIFAVPATSTPVTAADELLDTALMIVSFAEDVDGELYLLHFGNVGTIHKVENAP